MKFIVLLLVFFCTLNMSAKNILVNADFIMKAKDGNFNYWVKSGKSEGIIKSKAGTLTIQPKNGKSIVLIQKYLPVKTGKSYIISYEMKGLGMCYLDYTDKNGKLRSIYGRKNSTQNWQNFTSPTLIIPEGGKNAYFVVCGLGEETSFRKISMAEQKNKPEQKKNNIPGVSFLKDWRGGKFKQVDNQLACIGSNGTKLMCDQILTPGKSYQLEFEVKTIKGRGQTGFGYFYAACGNNYSTGWDDTLTNFLKKRLFFTAPKSGKVSFYILNRGTLAYRNFRITEAQHTLTTPIRLKLDVPYYSGIITSSERNKNISGTIESISKDVQWNMIQLKSGNKILASKKITSGKFTLKGTDQLPTGKYTLSITPYTKNKKEFPILSRILRKPKKSQIQVSYMSDNILRVNEKPFLALGFWRGLFNESVAYGLNQWGCNIAVAGANSSEELLKTLDIAKKYNIKLMFDPRLLSFARQKQEYIDDLERYFKYILTPKILEHPALLGYMLYDEPFWGGHSVPILRKAYELLKDIDPNRPAWINEAPRGTISEMEMIGKCCDIFGVDIYPIPFPNSHSGIKDKMITSVGTYTRRMKKSVHSRKPIWMALQAFSWTVYRHKKNLGGKPQTGYPTPAETRFMAFDAMTSSCNGIVYWGNGYIDQENFYRELLAQCQELRKLERFWFSGDTLKLKSSTGCVTYGTKIDGIKYLAVLNRTPKETVTGLELSGYYELPQKNKVISHKMPPYSIRLFATTPRYPEPIEKPLPKNSKLENEFQQFIIKKYAFKAPYKGNASWIWYPGESKKINSKVKLRRSFNLDKPVKKAVFRMVCDDIGIAQINQNTLAKVSSFAIMNQTDVSELLQKGRNTIIINAKDRGIIPCGCLAELEIELKNGEKMLIRTDATWQATKQNFNQWIPAEIIAPYGKGAWKSRTALAPVVKWKK